MRLAVSQFALGFNPLKYRQAILWAVDLVNGLVCQVGINKPFKSSPVTFYGSFREFGLTLQACFSHAVLKVLA